VKQASILFSGRCSTDNGKAIVIRFSPHVITEVYSEDLLKWMSNFNKRRIAIITHLQLSNVSSFVKKYNLNNYTNVYGDTEGSTYFVKNYHEITEMPFIALHAKKADQVKLFRKGGALP
jgi:hypothetical protein